MSETCLEFVGRKGFEFPPNQFGGLGDLDTVEIATLHALGEEEVIRVPETLDLPLIFQRPPSFLRRPG